MKTYYIDAAQIGYYFIIGYCDPLLVDKEIKSLPLCHKSSEAEIEALRFILQRKIETMRILTDSQAAVDWFRLNPYSNAIVEKVPRAANVANQLLSAFKQTKRKRNHG